jgi:hypothetical protein
MCFLSNFTHTPVCKIPVTQKETRIGAGTRHSAYTCSNPDEAFQLACFGKTRRANKRLLLLSFVATPISTTASKNTPTAAK